MKSRCAVPPEMLRRVYDPGLLGFRSTAELPELEGLVGQERAVRALELGLAMKTPGYNIFVAGPSGTGKTNYSRSLACRKAETLPVANDWVYVHNFDHPDEPQALALGAGMGPELARDVDELLLDARAAVGRALGSKEHTAHKEAMVAGVRTQVSEVVASLEAAAGREGFILRQTEQGMVPVPLVNGQMLTADVLNQMDEQTRRIWNERADQVRSAIADAGRQMWELEKGVKGELRQMDRDLARTALAPLLAPVVDQYREFPKVRAYLQRVGEELLANLELFQVAAEESDTAEQSDMGTMVPGVPFPVNMKAADPFFRFKVNVFVSRGGQGCPVLVETNPTYQNLFGKVELTGTGGEAVAVSRIKAGAVHRANGGFLILQAADLLQAPFAWDALKRALANREARIEPAGQETRAIPLETIRPEPIALDLKVILIGSAALYYALYAADEGFRKLFKIKAEFDPDMPATAENIASYCLFMGNICRRAGLRHLEAAAAARVLEHSHRLADDQGKLSARFGEVVEVIYEANAWAEAAGHGVITAADVEQAIREKAARSSQGEERQRELIEQGVILVDTQGSVVGQVNGLTVMSLGDYSFGAPSRITARTFMGEQGILQIEREIHMSGQIHDKGVLTLSGYLGGKFAQDKPLSLSASIAFEQTYGPVDGDSASSTELYALLSSLADVPIDQGIAVTGSVNQRGQVQPIGGVNHKIEGFFKVCQARGGLTGRQGVMIPKQNVTNLMLTPEVVEAARHGQFHIWAVGTIEEGVEILTGLSAGSLESDGCWAAGSLFERVNQRLTRLAHDLRSFN